MTKKRETKAERQAKQDRLTALATAIKASPWLKTVEACPGPGVEQGQIVIVFSGYRYTVQEQGEATGQVDRGG